MPLKDKDNNTSLQEINTSSNNTNDFLSEISPRDKPWDKHRSNVDKVEKHYKSTKEFQKHGERMAGCSELLDFALIPDKQKGEYKLNLASARFCRVRHCPVCQWRRSLMWKAKICKILPLILEKYPKDKYRWIFLTLTVKNCDITELKNTLDIMNKAWQLFSKRKAFPAIGWIRSTEVTKGIDNTAHPHFHCLLMVESSYFSGANYLSQVKWAEMWQDCMRVNYRPIVDVRAINKKQDPLVLIPEILKYSVKESDLVGDKKEDVDWLLELTRQMHRVRTVATGGILKEYLKVLENEPEDLIGRNQESENEVDEGHLYFNWKKKEKKYKLIED